MKVTVNFGDEQLVMWFENDALVGIENVEELNHLWGFTVEVERENTCPTCVDGECQCNAN